MNTITETAKRTITIPLFFPRLMYIRIAKITIRIIFAAIRIVKNMFFTKYNYMPYCN